MCSQSSDKLIARLKKNSIKYLFSIFKFRYLFRQQSKPDETSPTVLIFLMIKVCKKECFNHLYSVLLFSGLMTKRGFEPRIAPLQTTTVPFRRSASEKSSGFFLNVFYDRNTDGYLCVPEE